MSIHSRLSQALLDGDAEAAEAVALEALQAEINPLQIVNEVMIPTLTEVGQKFQNGEFFIPELLLAGRAAQVVGKHVEAAIVASGKAQKTLGVVVLGTVQGDIHDIGKSIVATMLRAHGFRVVDLGRDVSPSAFVDAAEQHRADIVGLSSLMTTTRPMALNTLRLFEEIGSRHKHRIIVGGGSVTPEWAEEIGADGYGEDAITAVEVCKQLLGVPLD